MHGLLDRASRFWEIQLLEFSANGSSRRGHILPLSSSQLVLGAGLRVGALSRKVKIGISLCLTTSPAGPSPTASLPSSFKIGPAQMPVEREVQLLLEFLQCLVLSLHQEWRAWTSYLV